MSDRVALITGSTSGMGAATARRSRRCVTELRNSRSPMGRAATPEEIADLVAPLCASDYVTGEIVIADGGLNLA